MNDAQVAMVLLGFSNTELAIKTDSINGIVSGNTNCCASVSKSSVEPTA